jgi:hypothetical protein
MHEVIKRRLSETPPVKAYVFVLATPDPSADMLAVICISVITVMVAVNDS